MVSNEHAVYSLLNSARPALHEGWDARDTGCGELSVRNLGRGDYAVLSAEAAPLLPLLDGSRTLNEVAAQLLRSAGRVRHQLILDSLVRLFEAGLLASLGPELDALLATNAAKGRPHWFWGLLGRLSGIPLHLPVRWQPPRPLLTATRPLARRLTALFAGFYLLGLLPYLGWALQPATAAATLGATPGTALFALLGGVIAAMSILALARTLWLLLLGRFVGGLGLSLTVLIPHLSAQLRDQAMLDSTQRRVYRAGTLALVAFTAAGLSLACLLSSLPLLFFGGLGFQLVLLADLSPLWPSDFAALLDEVFGSRRLKQSSARYLMKKLWRNLARKNLGREEGILMFLGSFRLAYLFLAVLTLAYLIPGTLDGVTVALLSPKSSAPEAAVAVLVTLYLWTALCFFALSILGTLLSAAGQLATAARAGDRPFEVKAAAALPLETLVQELLAIPPFASLPPALVQETLAAGRLERYRPGALILRQGDPGDCCFVLRSGRCKVEVEDPNGTVRQVASMGPGCLFGEVALLASSPRTSTVTALDEVEAIALDGATFLALVASGGYQAEEVLQKVRIHLFLRETDLLRGLAPTGMARLVNSVTLRPLAAGAQVVRAGDPGDSMYVIFRGTCEVLDASGRPVARLTEGQFFGEIALVTGALRTATVRCATDALLVELPSALYQEVLVQEFATGVLLDQEVAQRLEKLSLA